MLYLFVMLSTIGQCPVYLTLKNNFKCSDALGLEALRAYDLAHTFLCRPFIKKNICLQSAIQLLCIVLKICGIN